MLYVNSGVFNSGDFTNDLYFHFRVPPTPKRRPPGRGLAWSAQIWQCAKFVHFLRPRQYLGTTVLRLTSELYPNIGQNRQLYFSIYQLIISTAPSFLFVFILAQEHIDLVNNNQV